MRIKIIILIVGFFLFKADLFSQAGGVEPKPSGYIERKGPPPEPLDPINCFANPTPDGCNYIRNKEFSLVPWHDPYQYTQYTAPFYYGHVPNWVGTHGDAYVWDGVNFPLMTVPFTGAGCAWMGVYANFTILPVPTAGEGIAQKIPALQAGHKYMLSFYRKAGIHLDVPVTPLDVFDIYLIRCQDNTFIEPLYINPPLPAIYQQVYCETDIDPNAGWERVVVTFIADRSDYDVIWFYPREIDNGIPYEESGLFVSTPELIDVTNFTAGPPPTPTPGNCTVTIGPSTPNCSVKDAVFQWFAPGAVFPILAPPSQQIQVDASNPANVGTWTLKMVVPSAVTTNNTCSTQPAVVVATVVVPPCYPWPKAYYAAKYTYITTDNYDNVFLSADLYNITPNLNHYGASPTPIPPFAPPHVFQYNVNSGVCGWVQPYMGQPVFALNAGVIQTRFGMNYYFLNGTTGTPASQPPLIPVGEEIVAEKSASAVITKSFYLYGHTDLNIHTISGSTNVNADGMIYSKFNPVSNKLFVFRYLLSGVRLFVYDLSANTFVYITDIAISFTDRVVQIDNQDRLFVEHNGFLQEFNYVTGIYSSPIVISGFTNNNITAFYSNSFPSFNGPYTSDHCMVGHLVEENIYAIDLLSLTSRKINTTNLLDGVHSWLTSISTSYSIRGNTVFMSGAIFKNSISIGSQVVPFLTGDLTDYFTKLDLLTDFTTRPVGKNPESYTTQFQLNVYPNPARSTIRIILNEYSKQLLPVYSISIFDYMSNRVLQKQKYLSGSELDISGLKPGTYYIELTGSGGFIASKVFNKL